MKITKNRPFSGPKSTAFTWLTILSLVSIHYLFLAIFAVNAPFGDDFYCIYESAYKLLQLPSFTDKLQFLVEPWLEHSIAYTKLMAIGIVSVLGALDFKVFILLGNLHLLGILYLLTRILKQSGFKEIYFLPMAFLLLQPQTYEGLYWAGATSAYMSVIFYSFLCIYLLNKEGWIPFCGSMLAAVVSLYTFGSGLLVIPIAFGILLLRKEFKKSLIWAIFSAALLLVFFNYFHYLDSSGTSLLTNLKETPQYVFIYLFSFLGAAGNYREFPQVLAQHPLPFILGLSLSIALLYIVIAKCIQLYNQSQRQWTTSSFWTFIGYLAIIAGSAFTIALARGKEEVFWVFSSRYKIYSTIIICLLFIGVLQLNLKKHKAFLWISISLSALFCIHNYFYYSPKIKKTRDDLVTGIFNWQQNGQWLIYRETHYFERSANYISTKIDEKDSPYHFPKILPNLPMQAAADTSVKIQLVIKDTSNKTFWIASTDAGRHTFRESTFLLLKSEKNTFLFSTAPFPNSPKYFLWNFDIYKAGYYVNLSLNGLPVGNYRVGEFNQRTNSFAFSDITLTN